jgi:hypothetical protein
VDAVFDQGAANDGFQTDIRRAMFEGYDFITYFSPSEDGALAIDSAQFMGIRSSAIEAYSTRSLRGIVDSIYDLRA